MKLLCLIENLKEKEWKVSVLPKHQLSTNQKHFSFPVSIFTLYCGEEFSANFHMNMNIASNFVVERIFRVHSHRYCSLIHRIVNMMKYHSCEHIIIIWYQVQLTLRQGDSLGGPDLNISIFLKHRDFFDWRQRCQWYSKCEKSSAQGCCFKMEKLYERNPDELSCWGNPPAEK